MQKSGRRKKKLPLIKRGWVLYPKNPESLLTLMTYLGKHEIDTEFCYEHKPRIGLKVETISLRGLYGC